MKKLIVEIEVPDSFDLGPVLSNIETDLCYIIDGNGPDDSLHCPLLQYTFRQEPA